ncbi:sucrose-6-phosphate hydrolase [Peribacillus glennii]|uniref:Sucrose-6-phosphate hydrolase n=1 Tax=Peribacillus glennii TaxID=2303991 RepID=A0A372L737_9BACI|nr:sucrose-6-phosphate hydrolase [Peribacillus glennii]RFU60463.1 sucrose-6-phosphate hydrolase [Peribacillus glennii]
MEWTREKRYRRLDEASPEEMQQLGRQVDACPWRQTFHIQPRTGLLNDPNGFSYYNGYYHLFYQWFPLGPVHGLKYWYHMKSKDLVNWEDAGIGIEPDRYYDRHGAYSGSAIEYEDKLFLFYTGNTRDENWIRHPYQCLAVMDKTGCIKKLEEAVISTVPSGYTDHFRDPKIWKQGELFYAVIGAQRENETGCIVVYGSSNLTDWEFEGELETKLENFGYMWECPDYFEMDGQGVLIFSPQGLQPLGDEYQNIYQSGYLMGGSINLPDRNFDHGDFRELDRGFDFYAPQTMASPDGRRILVGWMGLPEIDYPTDKNGWAHCLTLPRELSAKNGRLVQKPVKELELLRKQESTAKVVLDNELQRIDGFTGTNYELLCEVSDFSADEFGIEFRACGGFKTVIKYDAVEKKVTLDRSDSGAEVGVEYGTTRSCNLNADKVVFHMFVDTSSVEIFLNEGEEVFTSRIFPDAGCDQIHFYAKNGRAAFNAKKWEL